MEHKENTDLVGLSVSIVNVGEDLNVPLDR